MNGNNSSNDSLMLKEIQMVLYNFQRININHKLTVNIDLKIKN